MRKKIIKITETLLTVLIWGVTIYLAGWGGYYAIRAFVCDQFVIPTESMTPTLIPGDRILVNKLIFGARIYKSFDFSDHAPLESWRTWGWRKIKPNDVLIFNFPYGYDDRNEIAFKINYVYGKRCIGTPGDTVSVINSFFRNSSVEGPVGYLPEQEQLSRIPDSLLAENVIHAMPFDKEHYGWTIKNMGPLYVPKKGGSVELDTINFQLYRQIIEYETGRKFAVKDHRLLLGETPVTHYTFGNNYYFTCGDNALNSGDSRYWGFVPEEFIVGVATRITYSRDRYSNRLRRDRILKPIH